MRKRTQKNYSNLPEVQSMRAVQQRKDDLAARRARVKQMDATNRIKLEKQLELKKRGGQ